MVSCIRRTPANTSDAARLRQQRILARREQRAELPMTVAPDFSHGDFTVEDAYTLFMQSPDELAFIVLDDDAIGLGFYQDHFLTLHTCQGEESVMQRFAQRLLSLRGALLERALILDLRQDATFPALAIAPESLTTRTFHLTREQWTSCEERLIHVHREESATHVPTTRLQNDVLSWIALSARTPQRVSSDIQAA